MGKPEQSTEIVKRVLRDKAGKITGITEPRLPSEIADEAERRGYQRGERVAAAEWEQRYNRATRELEPLQLQYRTLLDEHRRLVAAFSRVTAESNSLRQELDQVRSARDRIERRYSRTVEILDGCLIPQDKLRELEQC